MKEYKLIAFDMDGTLLNSQGVISGPVQAAVDKALDAGKTVIICTGRSYRELMDYDDREFRRIRYYVCENGALVYDSFEKKQISAVHIPEHLVRHILGLAEKKDAMIYLASGGQNMVNRKDAERMEYFHAERYKDIELRSAILHEDIIRSYREHPNPVEKMNLYSANLELRDEFYGLLKELPLSVIFAEESGLEIMPPGISKASGFLALCEYLKILPEETIAVGDSDNDVELLKASGLGVAMGNARACVKEISDAETADNDHDGCAKVIEKYLLNKI